VEGTPVSLSPDDIVNYEFRQQKVRGYDVEQVDDLLDRLADQVERTDREVDDLRRRLRESEARLAAALETESTLKRTLVTAQDAAERALAEAREQADELRETAERAIDEQLARAREEARTLVADAQREAGTELETARQQRAAVEARIEALRALEQRHRTSLERYLRAQLDQLEQLAADADAPSNAPAPDAVSTGARIAAPDPAREGASSTSAEPASTTGHEPATSPSHPGSTEPTSPPSQPSPADPAEPWTATVSSHREGTPPAVDHGLKVRVRGAEHLQDADQELGSEPPSDGWEGEPHR
jgi:DivIVA domain-containing protein